MREARLSTRVLHADAHLATEPDVAPPISVTTTWAAPAAGKDGPYIYSRGDTPIRARVEAVVGALEGGHAVLYGSGLAAVWAALVHYRPRRVLVEGGYHGTLRALDLYTRKYHVELAGLEAAPREGDLVWLETPLNPTCQLADVAGHAARARAGGAVVCCDATFAPPPLQRLLSLGAHCVMHSSTKYLAGHSDALGGVLVVAGAEEAGALREERTFTGAVAGSLEAWLLLRSLRTLPLRVAAQSKAAETLAAWLHSEAPHVTKVHHPSLGSAAEVELARRQMPGGFGAMLAFEVDGRERAKWLPQRTRIFADATSLGGVESLMEWRLKHDAAQPPGLLRVSVGLEDVQDLIEDLRQALLTPVPPPSAAL